MMKTKLRADGALWVWAVAGCLALVTFAPEVRAAGSFEWATAMGGPDEERGQRIAVDVAGNVYTTGNFQGTAAFGPFQLTSVGYRNIFVVKQAPDGTILWARSMGGGGDDWSYGIAVDGVGNVYTTGYFQSTADFDPGPDTFNLVAVNFQDIFVSKLDTDGNFVWARSMGGTSESGGYGIALDGAGNVYIAGAFQGTTDFDPGPDSFHLTSAGHWDAFVFKLDTDGNFVWARSISGADRVVNLGMALDKGGNIYTTGYFAGTADFDPGLGIFNLTSTGTFNSFVSKLDANGDFVWARATSGTVLATYDLAWGIAVDEAGYVYSTGEFEGTVDFDPGPDIFNLSSSVGHRAYVSKLDMDGDFIWARALGGVLNTSSQSIAVDSAGNVYTTGRFRGTADFDPSPGTFNLSSAGSSDIFVSKLDTHGDFIWARGMGGTQNDQGHGVALSHSGSSVYATGLFARTADFDPGPGTFNLTSEGSVDIFVVKLPNLPKAISITSATTGPTNAGSVDFSVIFDQAVVNFDDASDLVINHSGTANKGATIVGGPKAYMVTVEGISGDGYFWISVDNASDVMDLAGNPLASYIASAPVFIDNTPPDFASLTVSPTALAPGDTAVIQFTASEMLLGDPVVRVAGTPAEVAPLEVTKSLGHSYTWTAPADLPVGLITRRIFEPGVGYMNPDPWPYGPQMLEITLTDLAGNTITYTDPEGLALVSGLPVAWPVLVVLALLSAAAFTLRKRPKPE